jgi:hypothetical protein
LAALGGYRELVLIVFAMLLLAAAAVLLLAPALVDLSNRLTYLRWIAALAIDARRVVLGPKCVFVPAIAFVIHALTILIIWSVGQAQGLALTIPEAAVLFVVMIGVGLIPISVNGWGLREVAVVALLGRHGINPEQALLFSVCFGLILALASLPGALAWLVYSAAPAAAAVENAVNGA